MGGTRGLSQNNKDKLEKWLRKNAKSIGELYFKTFPDEEAKKEPVLEKAQEFGKTHDFDDIIGKWLKEPLSSDVTPKVQKNGLSVGLYKRHPESNLTKLFSYSKSMKFIYFINEQDALKSKKNTK